MHVWVVGHGRPPGVQHRCEADPDAETLGVRRDRQQGLRRRLEQEIVDHRLVVIGDGADARRQREHDVEVGNLQQLCLARLHPVSGLATLALGAMAVAAGVVGDGCVAAHGVLTARNMPAEGRRAAALDRAHHLQLPKAHVAAVGLTPSGTVVAEDIRDLQTWTGHERAGYFAGSVSLLELGVGSVSRSSGLTTVRRMLVATCV